MCKSYIYTVFCAELNFEIVCKIELSCFFLFGQFNFDIMFISSFIILIQFNDLFVHFYTKVDAFLFKKSVFDTKNLKCPFFAKNGAQKN